MFFLQMVLFYFSVFTSAFIFQKKKKKYIIETNPYPKFILKAYIAKKHAQNRQNGIVSHCDVGMETLFAILFSGLKRSVSRPSRCSPE